MMYITKCVHDIGVISCITLLLKLLSVVYVQGACTFPSPIRGTWVRGRNSKSLTFTGLEIAGLDIKYNSQSLGNFSCRMSSGDIYVIASNTYSTTIEDKRYYVCWKLVEVTNSAYILYELSDLVTDASYQGEPGIIESDTDEHSLSQICNKDEKTQTFTTLIERGASYVNISSPCPPPLIARYSYALCADTELNVCSDAMTMKANYSKCSTRIFNSANGVLSCMGSISRDSYTYLNLVRHDDGNAVTCFVSSGLINTTNGPQKFQTVSESTISGQYYSGDCTTTVMTSFTLTKIDDCTPGTSSNGSAQTSLIAGVVVGVLLLVIALFIAFFGVKKKMSTPVSVSDNNKKILKEHKQDLPDGEEPENLKSGWVHETANGEVMEPEAAENPT